MSLVKIQDLYFSYADSEAFSIKVDSFSAEKGQHIFLEGPSGSGKTTFLNLITGLSPATRGSVSILDTDFSTSSELRIDQFRADHFGIIFQMFNLIPYLNVIENIVLPCSFSKRKKENVLKSATCLEGEARRLCNVLDIDPSLFCKPVQTLSIGQQQRVAIARAVIGKPHIIIADEATSALDINRKNQFIDFLMQEVQKIGSTLIFVSHDISLKGYFDRVVNIDSINCSIDRKADVLS